MNYYCFEKYENTQDRGIVFRGTHAVNAATSQEARTIAPEECGVHINLFPVYVNPGDPYS